MLRTLTFALACLGGCTSPGPKPEADPELGATHYTLRTGKVTEHPAPLPTETEILVDWHDASGGTKTVPGFRGWDFIHEGRYQMIEVLGESGQTTTRLYDFAGEGNVEKTEP